MLSNLAGLQKQVGAYHKRIPPNPLQCLLPKTKTKNPLQRRRHHRVGQRVRPRRSARGEEERRAHSDSGGGTQRPSCSIPLCPGQGLEYIDRRARPSAGNVCSSAADSHDARALLPGSRHRDAPLCGPWAGAVRCSVAILGPKGGQVLGWAAARGTRASYRGLKWADLHTDPQRLHSVAGSRWAGHTRTMHGANWCPRETDSPNFKTCCSSPVPFFVFCCWPKLIINSIVDLELQFRLLRFQRKTEKGCCHHLLQIFEKIGNGCRQYT